MQRNCTGDPHSPPPLACRTRLEVPLDASATHGRAWLFGRRKAMVALASWPPRLSSFSLSSNRQVTVGKLSMLTHVSGTGMESPLLYVFSVWQ